MAMVTPDEINLTLHRIVTGDTREFLTKFTATQTALETFSAQLNPMVASIAEALEQSLQEAENTRQQAITDTNAIKDAAQQAAATATTQAGEAASSAAAAQQARDEAQQIATGEVAVTDLQPGTLAVEKDYVSVDAQGALVKRNLSGDVSEQLTAGDQSARLSRYDLSSVATATTLDLSLSLVFTVDASAPRTLEFANLPAASRDATIKVYIIGAVLPTFSDAINWSGSEQPTLDDNWTLLVFSINGSDIYGNKWGGA